MKVNRFQYTAPTPASLRVFFVEATTQATRDATHEAVGVLAKEGKKVMKANIKRLFPLYSDTDKHKRWQTPTGALEQSIGLKRVAISKMRNKNVAVAYVGARVDFTATKKVRKQIRKITNFGYGKARVTDPPRLYVPQGPKNLTIAPVRYMHLANDGHGPGPQGLSFYAKGRDFMTPTVRTLNARGPAILARTFPRKFGQKLEKNLKRVRTRIKRYGVAK